MKTIIVMMVLSIVYLIALDVLNKRIESINFSDQPGMVEKVEEKSFFTVRINGYVNNPGSYTVSKGSNLSYLITLAGGVKDNADSKAYNPNLILKDGGTYYISSSLDGKDKVSINDATIAQLDTLPGIGNVLATRIVTHRSKSGRFTSIEEITSVNGIGEALFEQIKDYICL